MPFLPQMPFVHSQTSLVLSCFAAAIHAAHGQSRLSKGTNVKSWTRLHRVTGMLLMWTFAEVSERPYWKAMSWAMLPSLVSAMCACTWHFFYNAPELEWLVAVQAGFTVLGNMALWWGAYHVYKRSQAQATEPS
eukprot:jgi/Ulvmu1/8439/UM043_0017.1